MFKILISGPDAEAEYFSAIDDLTLQLQYLLSTLDQQQSIRFESFEFLGCPIPGLQREISSISLKALIQSLNSIKRQTETTFLLQRLFGALTVITDDIQEAIERMDDLILAYTEELSAEDYFTNLLFTDNVMNRLNHEAKQILQQYKLNHLSIHELKQKIFGGLLAVQKFGQGYLLVQY